MGATIILSPASAVEAVAHEEQLRIWAHDLVGYLSMENFLREDLSYNDGIDLEKCVMRELKSILGSAFDHPEARTIKRNS